MNAISRSLTPLIAIALLAGCAINPVTGEPELALVSEAQEIEMGRQAAQQVAETIGLVDDPALQDYVAGIGQELARASERPELPWEFRVVDDPTPNAFALPGGFIFVTRGLMGMIGSEAQLAAVLGHEIGHVTARHSVSQMSRAQLAQLGLQIGAAVSPEIAEIGDLAGTGVGLLFLKYGRDDERQADELGFDYMLAQGYDVREMPDVFETLAAAGDLAGRSAVPTWLASHPSEPERIAAARRRIAALEPTPADLRTGTTEYLARIDGLVYGDDPRAGYFADGRFVHPELGFQFDVPDAWQKQNLRTVVQAISPDQDAGLALTLEPGTAEDAVARFLALDGIEPLDSERERIDGRTAVLSRFRARADGGTIDGIVAHIEGDDGVYRLITYAASPRFDGYRGLFVDIIDSFSGVSGRDLDDVETQRIEIVRLDRDMTLAEFASRYPSTSPLEELALINHVADGESRLAAGAEVKRIV
jgi:predicted Zn-dependent protease